MAVLGPSGCGKSTLLRVVAGLEKDFSGNVFYDDQNMKYIAPGERYIGMVFEGYALYPHFKGWEQLNFFFELHHKPREEAKKRIGATSKLMGRGFKKLLGRKPGTFSEGEQQRLSIARALARKPRLFLFDEPLSNLDAGLRTKIRLEIKRLLNEFNVTAIYVTHDQKEAIGISNRVAVMHAGKIEQVGTFTFLYHRPANAFVAGFLGNPPMNLFSRGIVSEGKLRLGETSVLLPFVVKTRVSVGQPLTLGVRPEAGQLCADNQYPPDGFVLAGSIELLEPDFGSRTQLVYINTGSSRFIVKESVETLLHVGQQVQVSFPLEHLYFFDTETGVRLS